jgi:hypothetical protein
MWAPADGLGGFGATRRMAALPSAFDLRIADLGGDGWPEILVVVGVPALGPPAATLSLLVYPNRPNRGFTQPPPREPVGPRPVDVATIDANRDGIPDLVVANRGDHSLSLLIGAGDGTFATEDRIETPAGLRRITVADLEADGTPEVIAACDSSGVVTAVTLLSQGRFGLRRDVGVGELPVDLASGDFDEDGRPEIVVPNRGDQTITVIASSLSGELSTSTMSVFSRPFLGPLTVLDLHGDGHQDIAFSSDEDRWHALASAEVRILRGDGAGGFADEYQTEVGIPGRLAAVGGADLDGDGLLDQFVVAGAGDSGQFVRGKVNSWIKGANGAFTTRPWGRSWNGSAEEDRRATAGRPTGIAAHDLDGDGFVEALVSDSSANAVFFLNSHPDGFLGPGLGVEVGDGPKGLAVADFDRDGHADVAVALAGADAVAILLGTGPDTPTSVLVSLIDVHTGDGRVTLRWQTSGAAAFAVERAGETGVWQEVSTISPDGVGIVRFVDGDFRPGTRYGYRLRALGDDNGAVWGEIWVDVPGGARLALRGAINPSRSTIRVAFSLESSAPASLELFDLMGRRVDARQVGALGPGEHSLALGTARSLAPGLYVVRLTSEGRSMTAKALLTR